MSDGSYSRREFLKIAGMAGAAVGAAGGLGGLLAACGGTEETTTSAAPAPLPIHDHCRRSQHYRRNGG